jgi:GntR family transcriptional repressor for pyruvate dehydrogenase complex
MPALNLPLRRLLWRTNLFELLEIDINLMLTLDVFDSVKTDRVSQIIIERIRTAILQGKIKPGDRLPPERILVEKFQAGKFSVREAIRTLEMLGFLQVKKGAGGGAIVTEVGVEPVKYSLSNFLQFQNVRVQNLCEMRMLLEPGAAEIAAIRRKKKDLVDIRRNLEKAQKLADSGKTLRELNVDFHRSLARSSYNPILILTLDYVLDLLKQTNTLLKPDMIAEFSANNLHAHWELFEAIRESDPMKAKNLMESHLRIVEKILEPLEAKLKVKF